MLWYGAVFGPLDELSILRKFAEGGRQVGGFESAMVRSERAPIDAWTPAIEHPKFGCAFQESEVSVPKWLAVCVLCLVAAMFLFVARTCVNGVHGWDEIHKSVTGGASGD